MKSHSFKNKSSEELEVMLLASMMENETLKSENKELHVKNETITAKYQGLLEQFKLARQNRFGRKTEKQSSESVQLSFFDEPGKPLSPEARDEINDTITVAAHKRKKKPKREALPEDLPREEIIIDLPETEKNCDCGERMTEIGEQTSEQLELIPMKLFVKQYRRKKYACKSCQKSVKLAKRPQVILPKAMAGPSLAAHVIVSKYVDHQPLYRQEQIFKRHGITIPRNSSCGWCMKIAEHCEPLMEEIKHQLLAYDMIQADETPVQVHREKGRKNTSNSYLWAYHGGPPDNPLVYFEYHPGRKAEFAKQFLKDFKGYLQTDAYSGYDFAETKPDITPVGCFAHARRPFAEALKIAQTPGLAQQALDFIGALYHIETQIVEQSLPSQACYEWRQEKSLPLLNQYHDWLLSHEHQVPAQTKTGQGIHYSLRHWKKLSAYTLDGRLKIDNNAIENLIRPFAVGRKNWLFMGSPQGAKAGATFYSLIATAKKNQVDPFQYLLLLFKKLPSFKGHYAELLPQNIRD